jgi:hypothetical protein
MLSMGLITPRAWAERDRMRAVRRILSLVEPSPPTIIKTIAHTIMALQLKPIPMPTIAV